LCIITPWINLLTGRNFLQKKQELREKKTDFFDAIFKLKTNKFNIDRNSVDYAVYIGEIDKLYAGNTKTFTKGKGRGRKGKLPPEPLREMQLQPQSMYSAAEQQSESDVLDYLTA
ncbi:hypothetical protein CHS0354_033618, partial [Potamilus streckersoni]